MAPCYLLFMLTCAKLMTSSHSEGRMSADGHRQLVESAAAAGMNTFRVWGGGIFYPRVWYDACDELGIMVYHDLMYVTRFYRVSPRICSGTLSRECCVGEVSENPITSGSLLLLFMLTAALLVTSSHSEGTPATRNTHQRIQQTSSSKSVTTSASFLLTSLLLFGMAKTAMMAVML